MKPGIRDDMDITRPIIRLIIYPIVCLIIRHCPVSILDAQDYGTATG